MDNETKNVLKFMDNDFPGPTIVEILFGEGCNQNCKFCSIYNGTNKPFGLFHIKDALQPHDYHRLIDECAELGVKKVQFSGEGEPLYDKKLTMSLMKKVKDYGMYGFLNTNGIMLEEEDIKQIVQMKWDFIIFSVESPDPYTHDYIVSVKGAYNRAIRNIQYFSKWKRLLNCKEPEIEMKMVISNKNFFQVEGMVKLARILDVNLRIDSLIVFNEYGEDLVLSNDQKKDFTSYLKRAEELAKLNKPRWFIVSDELKDEIMAKTDKSYSKQTTNEISKFHFPEGKSDNKFHTCSCYFPYFRILINTEGYVGPCGFAVVEDNVKKRSLTQIWKGGLYDKLRKDRLNQVLGDKCNMCGDVGWNAMIRRNLLAEKY